jgi:hypothetical protein
MLALHSVLKLVSLEEKEVELWKKNELGQTFLKMKKGTLEVPRVTAGTHMIELLKHSKVTASSVSMDVCKLGTSVFLTATFTHSAEFKTLYEWLTSSFMNSTNREGGWMHPKSMLA